MTPEQYLAKALHALTAAKLLLSANEFDGACNRAYYAMFNAAHAALLCSGANANPAEIRKHNSLIAAFGKYLVLTGVFPAEMGKSLNKAESIRLLADYTGEDIEPQQAEVMVGEAEHFVSVVLSTCKPVN